MDASKSMQKYFAEIDAGVKESYSLATKARKKGFDPEDEVGIPLAKNMAERVEGLVSTVAPEIGGSGISKRIKELEEEFGELDWRVALSIALEIAQEKHCNFDKKTTAMEVGIRAGIAYLTLGIVASPIEGFVELQIKKRKDGGEYFCIMYSGPIRSAGGTGAAVSVIVCDYVRKNMGYQPYDPTPEEIKRMVTELYDYHDRVTNLQYLPSEKEIEHLITHLPVQIAGDPSEKIEVSQYKDLERIETNRIRSGPCLVIGEGIAQKAPKLWKQLSKWGKEFDLSEWEFIEEFLSLQKKVKSQSEEATDKVSPVYTYISDLVAGRPVLSYPLREGGFRLRYGRSRAAGLSSAAIHPATTHALMGYIGVGTQLKVERPGKATAVSCCDTIEGPVVKLKTGDVVMLHNETEAKEVYKEIEEILFLGDILFPYGDFFNRAHSLIPAGYCEEWWAQELEKATVEKFGSLDHNKLSTFAGISVENIELLLKEPLKHRLRAAPAIRLSTEVGVALYPYFTHHWNILPVEDFKSLVEWLYSGKVVVEEESVSKVVLPFNPDKKRNLELIGLVHKCVNNEYVVIEKDVALVISTIFGLTGKELTDYSFDGEDTLSIINKNSPVTLRDKSGYFIGARMGRPEKAKIRKLTGSPHSLFPVGEEGGKMRSFQSSLEEGKITAEFALYHCESCKHDSVFGVCEKCGKRNVKRFFCRKHGIVDMPETDNGPCLTYRQQSIKIREVMEDLRNQTNHSVFPDLIKGVRGTSNKDHIAEHLMKGILRAKHDVFVNKDGTVRYDMSQLAITHFKPREINTPIEKLKTLGYEKDIHGVELTEPDQVLELKPQDIVIPACEESPDEGADVVLHRTSKFVDELLHSLYGVKKFYNLETPVDLAGELVVVLAPHTSAAIIGRIVGASRTQGFFAHPMLHAATRRDCDGDEASVSLLMDALLNFSRQFLPNTRGATQDAPLVLTSHLIPAEVDDMVFDMDVATHYPLEFYEACLAFKKPWEVEIDQLATRLNKPEQYEGMGFTHDTTDINFGARCSSYKTLPSMQEKLLGQMELAEKIRAVDTSDVAKLVIDKHFIRDIKGNLRKFSQQMFRCVNCNAKYRRPPLSGVCSACDGGKILFTISEGSIVKYLEPAIGLAEKYVLPAYMKQNLELTKRRVEGIFGKDKEKQSALGQWFS